MKRFRKWQLPFAAVALTAVITPLVVTGPALAQASVSPSSIDITSGAVCTGASGGQTYPVSITLPSGAVNDEVDVALLLDDTGSFSGEWSSVSSTFSSVVDQLETALPSVNLGFGVSMFKDYGGLWASDSGPNAAGDGDDSSTRPFILNQPIVTSATAGGGSSLDTLIDNAVGLADELPGSGGDTPEASLEGLYQLATGAGFDGDGNGSSLDSGPAGSLTTEETPGDSGDVPPFSSNTALTSGSLGGIGWRPGALHIAIVATDTAPAAAFPAGSPIPSTVTSTNGDSEPSINFAYSSLTPGDNRTGYVADTKDPATDTVAGAVVPEGGATVQGTINALNALGIRVIGMGPGDAPTSADGPDTTSSTWLSSIARLTGGTDSSGTPLVFDTSVDPSDLATAIVNNVETSATKPVNVGITTSTLPPGVTSVTPTPTTVDNVGPGGTAPFTLTIKGNGTAGSGSFTVNFVDSASGAVLGSVPVTVACPSAPSPTVTTSLTGGSTTGTTISVPENTAVTDQATLSGTNAASAGGSVTYDVYSDAACSTLVSTGAAQSITTPGTAPESNAVTLPDAGTYYWRASYSGDSTHGPAMSTCGSEVEKVTVPTPTSVTTSLSGGGQSGTSITVPAKTAVTDQATLSGTNAASATGTVTYDAYSDASCATPVSMGAPESITSPGTLPPSQAVTESGAGTYYWQAAYSGDASNQPSMSTCGSETETVSPPTARPKPTSISTLLTGSRVLRKGACLWIGDLVTVFSGSTVTDSATLSGPNVGSAGGTVTYTVYSSSWDKRHARPVASGGTVTVTNGSVPPSNAVTLPPGTYYWEAAYSGDALNGPSQSPWGSEVETVVPTPQCSYGWSWGFDGGCKGKPSGGSGYGGSGSGGRGPGSGGKSGPGSGGRGGYW